MVGIPPTPGASPLGGAFRGGPQFEQQSFFGVRLGEILVARAGVAPETIERALAKQREEGGLIGEIMVRLKLIDEDQLALALFASLPTLEAQAELAYRGGEQSISELLDAYRATREIREALLDVEATIRAAGRAVALARGAEGGRR